jgi:hypothetical protein
VYHGSLKVIFSEILRGFTLIESPPSIGVDKIKVKHFNNFDSAELDIKNRYFYEKAVEQGLPTRKERIDYLIKEEIWDEKKNKEIINLKSLVAGLKKSKSKLYLSSHLESVNQQLEEAQLKLSKIELKKEELIGFCAENYSQRRVNEHYMRNALLKENNSYLFKVDEFEELSEKILMELISIYNKSSKRYDSQTLKKVSLSPFFTNLFYLCDNNAQIFFGKPLVDLTFYQIELFGYGRYYKSLMESAENQVPDDVKEDPNKLVEWFDSNKSAKEVLDKSKNEGSATSLVGATSEDLKRLGLDNPNETINLAKRAAEKGGSLSMEDMMKIHGV